MISPGSGPRPRTRRSTSRGRSCTRSGWRPCTTDARRPASPPEEDAVRTTTRLRQLLTSAPLIVPGCYDAMSAKVLERAGFPAVYMTGYGTSLSLLGLPDAGLATMSEMHLNARYI